MNILFVSSLYPFPTDKGAKIRLVQLMRALSLRHEVSLLALCSPREQKDSKLIPPEERLSLHQICISHPRRLIKCIRGLASRKPLQVWYCESRDLRRRLREITKENRFDFVIFHLLRMADYIKDVERSRVILDIGDAVSQYILRSMEFKNSLLDRVLLGLEWHRVREYEVTQIPHFDCTILSSEADREVLQNACSEARLEVIPNAVDLEYLRPSNEQLRHPRIMFLGNFSYYPNVDAVMSFSKDILPLIWEERPELEFYVVGASPPKAVKALAADPRVVVTGRVPDVRKYLVPGSVFVCPVRFGGGTKFKVLEAMAMGLPVVTTEVGCEGIDVCDGRDLFVARSTEEFAQRVLQLAGDGGLSREMGNAARKAIEAKYDQNVVAKRLENLLLQLRRSGQ